MLKQVKQSFSKELSTIYDAQECKELFLLGAQELLKLSRSQTLLESSRELTEDEKNGFETLLASLKKGMPIQYALGNAWFYGMKLKVNESVLIPRPETEELVEMILRENPDAVSLIDIGTGSGCIPIAIKKNLPQMNVWGLDISTDALHVAKENAEQEQCTIHFVEADILSKVDFFTEQKFDVIVSNPPYITPSEQAEMTENVVGYEPHIALFIPEEHPLLFYEAIAVFAKKHLNRGGKLYFEINRRFGQELKVYLETMGFINIRLYQDMHGADRMMSASVQ